MLPKPLLVAAAPIVLVVVAVMTAIFVGRRAYRYPASCALGCAALGLYLLADWPGVLALAGVLGVALSVWAWRHWPSFDRTAARQARSEYRRAAVYGPRWKRTMRFSDLTKKVGRSVYTPKIRHVRGDGWRDRISVKLLPGQAPRAYENRAEDLAHSFGASSCRVRVDKPRRIVLDFIHSDPLARPVPLPALPDPTGSVDLRRLDIGVSETGRTWLVRLLGSHLLVAGSTGAGKASVAWSLVWALAPSIRSEEAGRRDPLGDRPGAA